MRVLLLFVAAFLCAGNIFPQKKYSKRLVRKHHQAVAASKEKGAIVLSLDTIFNNGIPYAILRKKKQLPYHAFCLYSLNNDSLILIQPRISINREKTPYYEFRFVASDNVAETEKYYGYNIATAVVEYGLVKNNRVDPPAETKFLLKHPRKFSNTTIKTYIADNAENKINSANIYELVLRNREVIFYYTDGGTITQDYKIIGRYKILEATLRFYLPNGIQVAEANANEGQPDSWKILTLKDSRSGIVKVVENDYLKELIGYLIGNAYL